MIKLTNVVILLSLLTGCSTTIRPVYHNWPREVKTIEIFSSKGEVQKARFYHPGKNSRALLMFLHGWSENYNTSTAIGFAIWCKRNNWGFLSPDFGGPFSGPGALGSKSTLSHILSARKWALNSMGDLTLPVYLVGVSGGALVALNLVHNHSLKFDGMSLWAPVTDLTAWHKELKNTKWKYRSELEDILGSPPEYSQEKYQKYSPIHQIRSFPQFPIEIHAGIQDGAHGPVPFTHSTGYFNTMCHQALEFSDTIPKKVISALKENKKIPSAYQSITLDKQPTSEPVIYNKKCGDMEIYLFQGGHVVHPQSSLNWLKRIHNLRHNRP